MRIREHILVATATALLSMAVLSPASTAHACCIDYGYGCVTWEEQEVTVYIITSGPGSLTDLLPTRSAAEWEEIVTNAVNIWREFGGTSFRFRIIGSGTYANRPAGAEMSIGSDIGCLPNSLADTYVAVGADGNEIEQAPIRLHKQKLVNGSCLNIVWQNNAHLAFLTADATGLIVHELGHAFGEAHPDDGDHCTAASNPSVMISSIVEYNRHLTRYDRDAADDSVGGQDANSYVYTLNSDWDNWSYATTFPVANDERFPLGTPSQDSLYVNLAWGRDFSLTHRIAHDPGTATEWYENELATGVESRDRQAMVAADDSGFIRHYFFKDDLGSNNVKPLCRLESSDFGITWSTIPICLTAFTSNRSGLSAAYDSFRKVYVVTYNDGCPASPSTPCNRIRVFTEPGPGSLQVGTAVTTLGHHSFWTPSIACKRGSTTNDRCLVAFAAAEPQGFLRWQQGAISATGVWQQSADLADGNIVMDYSPSVAFGVGDDRFHLAFTLYDWKNGRYLVKTLEKPLGLTLGWTNLKTLSFAESTYKSFSGAVLGTFRACFFGCGHGMRLYMLRYTE